MKQLIQIVLFASCLLIQFSNGVLDDQSVLVDFYNSLTNKGNLDWDTGNTLCGQDGVTCDGSDRVIEL